MGAYQRKEACPTCGYRCHCCCQCAPVEEYSEENIRRWQERDKLDPDLKPWVRATLGEAKD